MITKTKTRSSVRTTQINQGLAGNPKPLIRRFMWQNAGFTLIEIMIAMGIVGFVLGGIYTAYRGQVRTFNTQEQVVDMQQNVRVAAYFLERELRMAGLDPSGDAAAGITVASADTITFSMDFTGGDPPPPAAAEGNDNDGDGLIDEGRNGLDDDGDGLTDEPDEAEWYNGVTTEPNEEVTFRLSNDTDAPPDGICNGLQDNNLPCNLERRGQAGAPFQVIAANIDALNFAYLGVDPNDSSCGESCQFDPATDDPEDIRTIQITLVARAGATVRTLSTDFTNNTTYYNQPPYNQVILPPQNDNFRRIRLTTSVRCRNLGL
jgi:type IV pilus assembly protein PilW